MEEVLGRAGSAAAAVSSTMDVGLSSLAPVDDAMEAFKAFPLMTLGRSDIEDAYSPNSPGFEQLDADEGDEMPPNSADTSTTLSYPTVAISGHLWKRGRRTGQWKRGLYCISDASFCELAGHSGRAAETRPETMSIIPVLVDTKSRHSVRRTTPLGDVVSSELESPPSGWGGSTRDGRVFRLKTTTRHYVFKAENPRDALEWVQSFSVIAERNLGGDPAASMVAGVDVLSVEVTEISNASVIRINFRRFKAGDGPRVTDLKERLVERRGLLPSQQQLSVTTGGLGALEDDDALLGDLVAGSGDGVLRLMLRSHSLTDTSLCAGPDPSEGGGLKAYNDVLAISSAEERKWCFKLDWCLPVPCVSRVVFHKRFPSTRNLVNLLPMSDSWWREHLFEMNVTPQPVKVRLRILPVALYGFPLSLACGFVLVRSCPLNALCLGGGAPHVGPRGHARRAGPGRGPQVGHLRETSTILLPQEGHAAVGPGARAATGVRTAGRGV